MEIKVKKEKEPELKLKKEAQVTVHKKHPILSAKEKKAAFTSKPVADLLGQRKKKEGAEKGKQPEQGREALFEKQKEKKKQAGKEAAIRGAAEDRKQNGSDETGGSTKQSALCWFPGEGTVSEGTGCKAGGNKKIFPGEADCHKRGTPGRGCYIDPVRGRGGSQ